MSVRADRKPSPFTRAAAAAAGCALAASFFLPWWASRTMSREQRLERMASLTEGEEKLLARQQMRRAEQQMQEKKRWIETYQPILKQSQKRSGDGQLIASLRGWQVLNGGLCLALGAALLALAAVGPRLTTLPRPAATVPALAGALAAAAAVVAGLWLGASPHFVLLDITSWSPAYGAYVALSAGGLGAISLLATSAIALVEHKPRNRDH